MCWAGQLLVKSGARASFRDMTDRLGIGLLSFNLLFCLQDEDDEEENRNETRLVLIHEGTVVIEQL